MAPISELRKCCAVMFTDIVGYTAMTQQNEDNALEKIALHRKYLEEYTVIYHGEVIQYYGDGSLSTYDSVIDAVRCAILMQQAYQNNAHVPVRIGIHLGDFIMRDDSIFGDAVNIAARVQSEGIPGAVLVSGKVATELRNHPDIQLTSVGTYHLKNVDKPVQLFAVSNPGLRVPHHPSGSARPRSRSLQGLLLVALVALGVLMIGSSDTSRTSHLSLQEERIAIPEFTNLTSSPENDLISKMAAHWITTELIETSTASLVSYQSAVENQQNASAVSSPLRFAHNTGAVNVIQGAYFARDLVGDTLEFSATIMNLQTGELLNVPLPHPCCPTADPMPCIRELSSSISGYWHSKSDNLLTPPKYEAYKYYLEARDLWFEDDAEVKRLLEKCIETDPEFIDAYFLMLDWFYNQRAYASAAGMISRIKSHFSNLTPRQQSYLAYNEDDNQGRLAEAYAHFMQEYRRDPKDLFVNTTAMVMACEYMNNPRDVLDFFYAINPDSVDLNDCVYCEERWSMAIYAYHALGKDKKARKLADQLSNHVHRFQNYQHLIEFYVSVDDTVSVNHLLRKASSALSAPFRPYVYFLAGRQAELRGDIPLRNYYAEQALARSPDSSRMLARCYYLMDDLDQALDMYQLALPKSPTDNRIYAEMGLIYARQGDEMRAREMAAMLDTLKAPFDYGKTSYFKGRIAAHLGERERALELLRQSLNEGNKYLGSVTFDQDPDLLLLRNDPAYRKLLRRL